MNDVKLSKYYKKNLALIFFLLIIILFSFNNETEASQINVRAIVPGTCGNGLKEINEQCDDTDLGGFSCLSFGYTEGILECHTDCSAFIISQCSGTTNPPSGGGGGGGGSSSRSNASIMFLGHAYPGSKVYLLKDSKIISSVSSNNIAEFSITVSDLAEGNQVLSVYSEDVNGLKSALSTFTIEAVAGVTTEISGIFISPTIFADKEIVKRGDPITFTGQGIPNSEITIAVNSETPHYVKATTNFLGKYKYSFNSSVLEIGDHLAKSKAIRGEEESPESNPAEFKVGDFNKIAELSFCGNGVLKRKGDLNCDGKVNLIDFYILTYWFKKTGFPEKFDLNLDNKIDIIDFSIMVFYWTG